MVVAIMLIMTSITFISMKPVLKQTRVNNAYNTLLSAMRQARDNAVAQRTSYVVTLDATTTPNSVKIEPTFTGFQGAQKTVTLKLPEDIFFRAEPGIPTANSKTPDSFGTGAVAIDFGYTPAGGAGGQTQIYFCPDGSAQDSAGGKGQCSGNFNSGVVYIARKGETLSSRAITVWGATGRVRGWRLYSNGGGGYKWDRQ